MHVGHDERRCFLAKSPTLGRLARDYGDEAPVMWMIPQLTNLSEFCGCKEKLQGVPLEECATIIARTFGWLKVSEIMLFLYRFKAGRYGRFYGNVDPLVITTALRRFLDERDTFLAREEGEQEFRRQQEACRGAITWEEYCRRRGKAVTRSPLPQRESNYHL